MRQTAAGAAWSLTDSILPPTRHRALEPGRCRGVQEPSILHRACVLNVRPANTQLAVSTKMQTVGHRLAFERTVFIYSTCACALDDIHVNFPVEDGANK